jgi:hypothetical protein
MSVAFARVELRWFFTEGDGALGLKGIDYNRGGGPRSEGAETARRHQEAVARWTEVQRRLDAIPASSARTLSQAFSPHRWPRQLVLRWYELVGVAAWMVEPSSPDEAVRQILAMSPEKAEELRAGAAAKLRLAVSAFASVKPGAGARAVEPSVAPVSAPVTLRDTSRTWVPTEEGRGTWLSPGEHEVRCVVGGGPRRVGRGPRCTSSTLEVGCSP